MHKALYAIDDIYRLYVTRKEGEIRLARIENYLDWEMQGLSE